MKRSLRPRQNGAPIWLSLVCLDGRAWRSSWRDRRCTESFAARPRPSFSYPVRRRQVWSDPPTSTRIGSHCTRPPPGGREGQSSRRWSTNVMALMDVRADIRTRSGATSGTGRQRGVRGHACSRSQRPRPLLRLSATPHFGLLLTLFDVGGCVVPAIARRALHTFWRVDQPILSAHAEFRGEG